MAKKKLLPLTCTVKKQLYECAAAEMYLGNVFKLALKYGKLSGKYDIYILSAKYGFIRPSTVIKPYDEVMPKGGYVGVFPKGVGFYVGSKAYFANAPRHVRPLLRSQKIGNIAWMGELNRLIKELDERCN